MCIKLPVCVCVHEGERKLGARVGHIVEHNDDGGACGELPQYHLAYTVRVFSGLQSRLDEHTFPKHKHTHIIA